MLGELQRPSVQHVQQIPLGPNRYRLCRCEALRVCDLQWETHSRLEFNLSASPTNARQNRIRRERDRWTRHLRRKMAPLCISRWNSKEMRYSMKTKMFT